MVTLTITIPSIGGKPAWQRSMEVSVPTVGKGFISIQNVPKPAKLPYPVNISIDGVFIGQPPIMEEVDPGIHTVVAELKSMTPISRKVRVKSDETITITDIRFEEIVEICREGEERTRTCPDGTAIVIERCERDPATSVTGWVPTGKVCPPKAICIEGEERTRTCPDGTVIVTDRCERDPATGLTRWTPTGAVCPPVAVAKVVQILAAGQVMTAWDGQEITIAVSVMCGLTPSSGEEAILTVDGIEVARNSTSNGMVEYKWTASAEPTRFRKICITVPVSEVCKKYSQGRDCKTISVSREVPPIYEQLRKEREAYAERSEAIRKERERIRELPVAPAVAVPQVPVITPPTPPITLPVIPPIIPPTPPSMGQIVIPGVPKPPGWPYNIEIYLDGENLGAPPISKTVTPGKHTLEVKLRGFTPISRTITVAEGQTVTITDIVFG